MSKQINNAGKSLVVDTLIELGATRGISPTVNGLSVAISQQQGQQDLDGLKDSIDSITSDSIITPAEKQGLSREWGNLLSSYASLKSKMIQAGLEDSVPLNNLTLEIEALTPIMNEILGDMVTPFPVPGGLNLSKHFVDSWQRYNEADYHYSESVSFSSKYTISIDGSKLVPETDAGTTLTCNVYQGDTLLTDPEFAIDAEFVWTRFEEPEAWPSRKGKRIEIKAADLTGAESKFLVQYRHKLSGGTPEKPFYACSIVTFADLKAQPIIEYTWADILDMKVEDMASYVWTKAIAPKPAEKKYLWTRESLDFRKTWSLYRKTGEQGIQGPTGPNGYSRATVPLYQRSATQPKRFDEIEGTTDATYTFSTATLSIANSGPWSQTMPQGEDKLWVIYGAFFSDTSTDTIGRQEWTSPVELSTTGTQGEAGKSVTTVFIYQRSETPLTAADVPQNNCEYNFLNNTISGLEGTNWTPKFPSVSSSIPTYISIATAVSVNGETATLPGGKWSAPEVLVKDGVDGVGVESIVNQYAVTQGEDIAPVEADWKDTRPDRTENEVLWTREKITYTNRDIKYSSARPVTGDKGNAGNDGISITGVVIEFQIGDSATIAPTGTWSETRPTEILAGKFLWTRERISYSKGPDTYTTPKNVTGEKGATGEAGQDAVIIRSEAGNLWNFSADPAGLISKAEYKKFSTNITCQQGKKLFSYDLKLGSNGTFWIEITSNEPQAVLTHEAYKANLAFTDSSTPFLPLSSKVVFNVHYKTLNGTVDSYEMLINFTKSKTGLDGKRTEIQYYVSDSDKELVGGSWVQQVPPVPDGKFLWQSSQVVEAGGDINPSAWSAPVLSGTNISIINGKIALVVDNGKIYPQGNEGEASLILGTIDEHGVISLSADKILAKGSLSIYKTEEGQEDGNVVHIDDGAISARKLDVTDLFTKKIQLKLGGAIYGGIYDENGLETHPDRKTGIFISEEGEVLAFKGTFTNAKVTGQFKSMVNNRVVFQTVTETEIGKEIEANDSQSSPPGWTQKDFNGLYPTKSTINYYSPSSSERFGGKDIVACGVDAGNKGNHFIGNNSYNCGFDHYIFCRWEGREYDVYENEWVEDGAPVVEYDSGKYPDQDDRPSFPSIGDKGSTVTRSGPMSSGPHAGLYKYTRQDWEYKRVYKGTDHYDTRLKIGNDTSYYLYNGGTKKILVKKGQRVYTDDADKGTLSIYDSSPDNYMVTGITLYVIDGGKSKRLDIAIDNTMRTENFIHAGKTQNDITSKYKRFGTLYQKDENNVFRALDGAFSFFSFSNSIPATYSFIEAVTGRSYNGNIQGLEQYEVNGKKELRILDTNNSTFSTAGKWFSSYKVSGIPNKKDLGAYVNVLHPSGETASIGTESSGDRFPQGWFEKLCNTQNKGSKIWGAVAN